MYVRIITTTYAKFIFTRGPSGGAWGMNLQSPEPLKHCPWYTHTATGPTDQSSLQTMEPTHEHKNHQTPSIHFHFYPTTQLHQDPSPSWHAASSCQDHRLMQPDTTEKTSQTSRLLHEMVKVSPWLCLNYWKIWLCKALILKSLNKLMKKKTWVMDKRKMQHGFVIWPRRKSGWEYWQMKWRKRGSSKSFHV